MKVGKGLKVCKEVKDLNKKKEIELKTSQDAEKLEEINEKLSEIFIKEQRENLETGIKELKVSRTTKGKDIV